MATLSEPFADTHRDSGRAYLKYLKYLTPPVVRYVEVRADITGDVPPEPLRAHISAALLYTLRSTAAGGDCPDSTERRHARLIAAAGRYDYVDLEADRDLHPDVLAAIPPERRVVSWHGAAADLAGLRRALDRVTAVKARLYRLVSRADTPGEAVLPLLLLASAGRDDVMAYAAGPAGTWTRVLTAKYGAPLAIGRLDAAAAAGTGPAPPDGELPLPRLLADYPDRLVSRAERLYAIIGASTTLSLAPLVHNTAYRELDLPALFLPFSVEDLGGALAELGPGLDDLGLPLSGATVVRPHKDTALELAADASPLARRAHAASLLVRTETGWWADTEAAGVVATLTGKAAAPAGRRIAVIGAGGAGRAAAAGLAAAGAEVTLANRGTGNGERAAALLGLPFVPLRDLDPTRYSVLVHATPVVDDLLFRMDGLDPETVIFDLNYRAEDTALVAAARAGGHVTIDGKDMLLAELSRQFQLMTGRTMPTAKVAVALAGTEG
ncbi:MAG TPA: type I 3-dehydroquinate dehydratase [Streptosporangiaceae bacterium]|nr:type I 3-dehydroquinate dehydratase [Streptosporangiaceae bacterium]